MKKDTASQFAPMTLLLHWLVGLTMIGLLAIGVYMVENKAFALFPWHKSFGLLIFGFVLLRVVWRMKNGWPTPVGHYSKIEHILAHAVHWVLILGTLIMPISGFLNSALGGFGVEFFGLELIPKNIDPDNPKKVLPLNEGLYSIAHGAHYWVGYALIGAIILHVVGAVKHHVVDKDGTLRRMLGAKLS
ncbi:RNA methyltransferase [Vibrio sp. 10N.286.49.C2]|uniref:cytochrome b n=1 Tax=unclassified Vibrio TaxID=2614977 RepID=UPI000C831267|nr:MULTISPECIES: cytochrome b [unclassified Vibrio]PMH34890.1 RNA methyltransferase [Vibrio sp. 10N.286.49.C2]PMH51322.1 RNA methyltransferase [Vibrio sp. 10N.286.49.B1]PMH83731.1 RNA methyltransferase [Vibrio sp. 10N.286.48.B7]